MFVTGKMRTLGRIRGRISRRGGNVGGLRQVRLHLAPAESRATIKFVERDFSPPHQLIHSASRPAHAPRHFRFVDERLRRRFRRRCRRRDTRRTWQRSCGVLRIIPFHAANFAPVQTDFRLFTASNAKSAFRPANKGQNALSKIV